MRRAPTGFDSATLYACSSPQPDAAGRVRAAFPVRGGPAALAGHTLWGRGPRFRAAPGAWHHCQRVALSATASEVICAGAAATSSAANTRGAAVWYPIQTSPPALLPCRAIRRPARAASTQPLS